ncbi:MAG: hypothetical protein ACRC8A_03025, partial [Microcoleaceae cyanobacterium]
SPKKTNLQRLQPNVLQNWLKGWVIQGLNTLIFCLEKTVQQLESGSSAAGQRRFLPKFWNFKSILIAGIVMSLVLIFSTKTGLFSNSNRGDQVSKLLTSEALGHTPVLSEVQIKPESQVKPKLAPADLPLCQPEAAPELIDKLANNELANNELDSASNNTSNNTSNYALKKVSEIPENNSLNANEQGIDIPADQPENIILVPAEIVAIAPPEVVALTEAVVTQLNLEQQLLNSIQAQVAKKFSLSGNQIILSVQAGFLESLLQVKLSSQWYQLTEDKQNQLIKELWKQAQKSDFTKLAVMNPQDKLIARNPMVGSEIIILERKIDETL